MFALMLVEAGQDRCSPQHPVLVVHMPGMDDHHASSGFFVFDMADSYWVGGSQLNGKKKKKKP